MTGTPIKKIFMLVDLLLAGLMLWTASSIVSFYRSHSSLKAPQSAKSPVIPGQNLLSSNSREAASYALISLKDIFHTQKDSTQPNIKDAAELHETALNLALKGTVVGEGPQSYAVILDLNTNTEKFYIQGDFVMGARIAQIHKGKVVLDAGGVMEALRLEQGDEVQGPTGRNMPTAGVTPPGRAVSGFIAPRRN